MSALVKPPSTGFESVRLLTDSAQDCRSPHGHTHHARQRTPRARPERQLGSRFRFRPCDRERGRGFSHVFKDCSHVFSVSARLVIFPMKWLLVYFPIFKVLYALYVHHRDSDLVLVLQGTHAFSGFSRLFSPCSWFSFLPDEHFYVVISHSLTASEFGVLVG